MLTMKFFQGRTQSPSLHSWGSAKSLSGLVCSHRRHVKLDNLRTLILADNELDRLLLVLEDDDFEEEDSRSSESFETIDATGKNVTIKDVIYWVSESWDNVTQNCLVRSWKKLWPSLACSSKVEQGEANKSEILPLIKCTPDYEDATEHTVTEWLSCDTEANQLYADEGIISLVQNKPQDDSELEETDEPENVFSHS
ncbi:hypothetical protein AVEN_234169-1 [Araneus ventricosus]|uniref:DDE-1 domain-containing protein n=1 Tax=Araneus ventricosus TaxID=182803 RepID=A0A4Y2K3H3_ARAVE|nr:hypothetical protein AVEN_234169-1 [Araneus ventricosus]